MTIIGFRGLPEDPFCKVYFDAATRRAIIYSDRTITTRTMNNSFAPPENSTKYDIDSEAFSGYFNALYTLETAEKTFRKALER